MAIIKVTNQHNYDCWESEVRNYQTSDKQELLIYTIMVVGNLGRLINSKMATNGDYKHTKSRLLGLWTIHMHRGLDNAKLGD